MTLATEQAATDAKDPRDLVPPQVWDRLVAYIAKDRQVTQDYAAQVFGQTLVFLKAHADSIGSGAPALALADGARYRVVPDVTVDVGWHAFLQHTEDYTAFCEQIAGRYLHHRPVLTKEMADGTAMARYTLPALHATGYRVDLRFWRTAYSCCPPECAPPLAQP